MLGSSYSWTVGGFSSTLSRSTYQRWRPFSSRLTTHVALYRYQTSWIPAPSKKFFQLMESRYCSELSGHKGMSDVLVTGWDEHRRGHHTYKVLMFECAACPVIEAIPHRLSIRTPRRLDACHA
ncbi:hypothetical protein SERLA73DRAFT_174612 [Serpula lacrymans var. lacrymans S7.3]|uniref:Uncharacterized protein n=2 Tax=Serpula lacrymans var. lacrymans TaxID=341189 RepID=F8PJ02_SERL3|nr:uncharacterized protein SERLADRAFT_456223 [Serpula lacrymans var. lacrymans S7.9]EGO03163.1 hypothetical protein SERLA73DRAFT_174612 [Serpula lacrymans var. lacrymans S7.3]EGO28946.1 hypothetical protein SERLADRAFT_456223 [Serpula lacrymans var. lacrymans S7.9]